MAAQSNGKVKKSRKPTQNGQLNGHANGHIEKTSLSSALTRPSRQGKPRRSIMGNLTNIVARLSVWYLIITIAFRCPSSISKVSEASPQICEPYLHARSYVTPYLDPYYQAYVAPQLEKAQPYVDRYYTPAASFTKDKYATYGAHRVEHAQKYVETEWDRSIRPQIQSLQGKAKGQYDLYLGPYVQQASTAVHPHYERTKDSLSEIYHLTVLPTYEAVLPYSHQAYAHGQYAVTHVIFPYVRYGKDISWTFLTRTVWPQLRVLYGDNVEPQLVRIRERLGRHRDQQKIESAVDAIETEVPTASDKITSQTSISASEAATPSGSGWDILNDLWPSESLSSATEIAKQRTSSSTAPAPPKLTGAELRESLNNDLRQWQTKFAVAADKGSEDLEQRVAEITDRQVENSVKGHGAALMVQLEETADSTVAKFKKIIQDTVKTVPEDASEADLEAAYEKCIAKTRELGLVVKERAQAVRDWKAKYDQETDTLVQAAVRSTVDVLERIHGLGLQEVGMRWAWTDGVEYNDWQNYHKLRNTLTEWQDEVEAVGAQHEGLKVAHEEAKKLEDNAMNIASKMVGELIRLKDVSKWKIWANDSTDDFSNRKVPARAFKAATDIASGAEDAASKASAAIVGSETPATESLASAIKDKVSSASSSIADASSAASNSIVGTSSKASASAVSASSKASASIVDASSSSATPSESVASAIKNKASGAPSKISEAAVGSDTDNKSSSASDAAKSVQSKLHEEKEDVKEKIGFASQQPKQQKVFGGAMAQVIAEAREIVFDDEEEETYSKKLQSMVGEAGDRASDLSRAVSEALLEPSKTQGTVESVTSLANEQYASAIAAASSVLYGTEQQPIESATSVASEKFAQAVTAASYAIYGTPTPTAVYRTVQVQASSRYNQALSLANEQYSNAVSQLSVLASGTPKPAHETLLSYIENAYSDSVAAASERLQVAAQYTDSVKSYAAGPTQGYFESVSSIAASKLSEGISAASAQFTTQPTPALDGARRQYYEAIGLAHARYSDFLNAASSAVYGPEQGSVESYASVASASAASLASQVSSGVVGTETPWAESVASGAASSAQSIASKASEAAQYAASQASSGVIGSETPWTESVASQASANWEALIAKASTQVYGSPTPWAQSVYSQAGAYGAQATAQAAEQYVAVQALISELVIGKEPDFTESVMNRFSSAYYTAIPAVASSVESFFGDNYQAASSVASENLDAASSYASESYETVSAYAADAYASASSVVSSVFTPPPAIETILNQANDQLNAAVESASVAVYGTSKGNVEQATESVASAYSAASSKASEAIYGTQQASASFAAVAADAQARISEAIFGTPTPKAWTASVTNSAESVYSSVASVASENAAAASSAISSAIYGAEQGAVESASSRLALAIEAANSRISELYASASVNAGDAASSVSSAVTGATQRAKDEL